MAAVFVRQPEPLAWDNPACMVDRELHKQYLLFLRGKWLSQEGILAIPHLAFHLWQLLHPSSGPLPGDPSLPKEASNLDFAAGTQSWFLAGDTPEDYAYGIDLTLRLNGKASASLKAGLAETVSLYAQGAHPRVSVLLD